MFPGQIRNSDPKEVNVSPVLEVTPRVPCFHPLPLLWERMAHRECAGEATEMVGWLGHSKLRCRIEDGTRLLSELCSTRM